VSETLRPARIQSKASAGDLGGELRTTPIQFLSTTCTDTFRRSAADMAAIGGAHAHASLVPPVQGTRRRADVEHVGCDLAVVDFMNADAARPVPQSLTDTIEQITSKPQYAHTTWRFRVEDRDTGELQFDQGGNEMSTTGSILKVYSTSTALHFYGSDHRFRTPVFRTGPVRNGGLHGDLVVVASGDFSMGLREQPDGSMVYASAPNVDHTYANTGLPAIEVGADPLAALNELAEQVAASGIKSVEGGVVIDHRLFDTFFGWPDVTVSPATPIMINDNRIDILSTPTTPGAAATFDYRPKTAAFTVQSDVMTVPAGQPTDITVSQPQPNVFAVSGTIAADAGPTLRVGEIPNPADFARTAFIEALERAGVAVKAEATGENPAALLPAEGTYQPDDQVAEHVSGELSEIVKVIMKTSHNQGADLMACLDGVASGSKNCEDGLVTEQQYVSKQLGVDPTAFYIFDGAGSDDRDRSAGSAITTFLRAVDTQPYATTFEAALPTLGVDGDLANQGLRTEAVGHVHAKTGTRAGVEPAGIGLLNARTQVGYIDAASGRRLVFTIMLENVPFPDLHDVLEVIADVANISVAMYDAY
jgi:serine-type D-Ala-D-Ala carboxypeptidase/endopeptidase (penicillin-binding protein 4)